MEASAEQKGVDYQKPHKFDHHQVVCNFYIHISDFQTVTKYGVEMTCAITLRQDVP